MKKYLKKIYNKNKSELFNELKYNLKNKKKTFIVTVNPEAMELTKSDEIIKEIFENDDVVKVPDGIGVVKACKWANIKIEERIAGIEIAQELLKVANDNSYSLYLFGAEEQVIKALVKKIKKDYKNINLVGSSNGYVLDKDKVMKKIIKLKPDICMVALGVPNQEKIIYKYLDKFKKGVLVGVGGTFDVLSGTKKRAPEVFIKFNLEWFYRIITEPKRIKRFFKYNVKFVIDLIKERD